VAADEYQADGPGLGEESCGSWRVALFQPDASSSTDRIARRGSLPITQRTSGIAVTERETPVVGGTTFGAVETYERLHGTVFGERDRTHRQAHGDFEVSERLPHFEATPQQRAVDRDALADP